MIHESAYNKGLVLPLKRQKCVLYFSHSFSLCFIEQLLDIFYIFNFQLDKNNYNLPLVITLQKLSDFNFNTIVKKDLTQFICKEYDYFTFKQHINCFHDYYHYLSLTIVIQ